MNHRERVNAILSGRKLDKAIVDLGGRVASFCTPAYIELKKYLGFGDNIVSETITFLNTIGEIDQRVLEFFDIPIRRIFLKSASNFQLEILDDGSFFDEWGVKYVPRGFYNERTGHPLAIANINDLQTYSWPDPKEPGRVKNLKEDIIHLYRDTDYAIAAGHISAGIFQDCWNLRGMQKFFEDMISNKDFAIALLNKVAEIHIGLWEVFLNEVGDYIDIVETADDLGSQNGLLISPKMYREMIKPFHMKLNSMIHERTNAKIFFHSCGAIMSLISDIIDTGVDILNPIQPIKGKMDPMELKERFGNRLVFHGGLDVQELLLHASPKEVAAFVKRYYDALGVDHFIMAPTNSIQPGTPPENIVAAYRAAKDFI